MCARKAGKRWVRQLHTVHSGRQTRHLKPAEKLPHCGHGAHQELKRPTFPHEGPATMPGPLPLAGWTGVLQDCMHVWQACVAASTEGGCVVMEGLAGARTGSAPHSKLE